MDAVFYFLFHEQDFGSNEPNDRHLAFYLTNLNRPWSEIENDVYEYEEQLEMKYGVHNWLGYSGGGANVLGYSSYEVEAHHYDELMQQWRQSFLSMSPGCVVSDVFALAINRKTLEPTEIFQHTKDAYEQQQAQLLRDRLNANITISASPTAAKKM